MRRSLRTTAGSIATVTEALVPAERVVNAFLADDLLGVGSTALVQFSDPSGARGAVTRARIQPGVLVSSLPAGSPVTVRVRHGQAEVIGVPRTATGLYGLILLQQGICSADVTGLGTTYKVLPGTTITVVTDTGDLVEVLGVFDAQIDTPSNNVFIGTINIDGVDEAQAAHAELNGGTAWRGTVVTNTVRSDLAPGSHAIELHAATLNSSGSMQVRTTHSLITVRQWRPS